MDLDCSGVHPATTLQALWREPWPMQCAVVVRRSAGGPIVVHNPAYEPYQELWKRAVRLCANRASAFSNRTRCFRKRRDEGIGRSSEKPFPCCACVPEQGCCRDCSREWTRMSALPNRQSSAALLSCRNRSAPEWKGSLHDRREGSIREQRGLIRTASSDSRVQGDALAPRMKLSQCSIHS